MPTTPVVHQILNNENARRTKPREQHLQRDLLMIWSVRSIINYDVKKNFPDRVQKMTPRVAIALINHEGFNPIAIEMTGGVDVAAKESGAREILVQCFNRPTTVGIAAMRDLCLPVISGNSKANLKNIYFTVAHWVEYS